MEGHQAAGILVHDERVLLCHRTGAPSENWEFPGGTVGADASGDGLAGDGLAGHLFDQLGISATIHGPTPDFSLPSAHGSVEVWVVRLWEGTPRNMQPDRYDDVRWFSLEEVLRLRLPAGRYASWLSEELSFSA